MKSTISLTVAAFTLAGCLGSGGGSGGGGGGGDAPGPTSRDIGILPSGFVATYDSANDELVLTIDGAEVARLPSGGTIGGATTYVDSSVFALYAQTISDDGAVFVVSSLTADLGLAGVQVARLGDTVLPGAGSATFNGGYAGVIVDTSTLGIAFPIIGTAQLTADFASASISGDITDRAFGSDDIQLLPTAITSAGAFSGTTTGGNVNGFGATASDGTYVGLIVGATGNEVVGGVNIPLSGNRLEIGGFVAAE